MVKDIKGLIATILLALLVPGAHAAILNGTIYEWSDFEHPLKNVIVEVNSTPVQYKIVPSGVYSFNLPPGNYLIKAKYYRNNVLEYVGEDNITIGKADESMVFEHDIILFPPTDTEYEYLGDVNLTGDIEVKSESDQNTYALLLLVILSAVAVTYWARKKALPDEPVITAPIPSNAPSNPSESAAESITRELPEDLRELLALIQRMGGRATQKDLRKEMKCSEAKVSLMLDDLEDRGLIKKIKKGRSNVVIAEGQK